MKFKIIFIFFTAILLSGCTINSSSSSLASQKQCITDGELLYEKEYKTSYSIYGGLNSTDSDVWYNKKLDKCLIFVKSYINFDVTKGEEIHNDILRDVYQKNDIIAQNYNSSKLGQFCFIIYNNKKIIEGDKEKNNYNNCLKFDDTIKKYYK